MTLSPTSISNILPPEFKLLSYKQIASLWSNYGHIYRLTLDVSSSTTPKPLILKAIHPPSNDDASESHLRKLLSYKVERWFYHHLAPRLRLSQIKVSKVYLTRQQLDSKNEDDGNLFLEDLSTEFPFPADGSLGKQPTLSILDWLAGFHGTFFTVHGREALELVPPPKEFEHASTSVKGVWRRGTYWYLDTRREELSEMNEEEYSWLMPWIAKVNNAIDKEILTYGTLLHGDVKGANILLNRNPYDSSRHSPARSRSHIAPVSEDLPLRAALYDFQYVGIGLSTLDLVYFIGTSIQSSLLSSSSEMNLLRHYHSALLTVIRDQTKAETNTSPYPFDVFLKHWELAIVDWYRFMAGWGFWGNDRWAEQRAKEIVKEWGADPTTAPA